MRIVVYEGGNVGLLKEGQIVDVTDLAGARADEWPPVVVPRLIVGFPRLRPRLEEP